MLLREITEDDESVAENTVVVDSFLSLLVVVVVTKVNTAGVETTFCKTVGSASVSERIAFKVKKKIQK